VRTVKQVAKHFNVPQDQYWWFIQSYAPFGPGEKFAVAPMKAKRQTVWNEGTDVPVPAGNEFFKFVTENWSRIQDRNERMEGWALAAAAPGSQASVDAIFDLDTPKSVLQALRSPQCDEWVTCMMKELHELESNSTWEFWTRTSMQAHNSERARKQLAPLTAIKAKWVYRIKQNADGTVSSFKSRLVAAAWNAVFGVDYFLSYAPVLRFASMRILLGYSAQLGYQVFQLDIKNAYVLASLPDDEYVFSAPPPGCIKTGPNGEELVLRLRQGLYGLVQSGRLFADLLTDQLLEMGFQRSKYDPCVYTREGIMIGVYVDDILCCCRNKDYKDAFVAQLDNGVLKDKVKDEGIMTWCLGMEVKQDQAHGTITLSQQRYLRDCLATFGWTDAAPAYTPAAYGLKLTKDTQPTEPEVIAKMAKLPYRQGVGKALYATVGTRGDCAYEVQQLTRHVNNPSPAAWGALKRLFRYFKHTMAASLVYRRQPVLKFYAHVDADWASCTDTRKSVTGFIIMLAGAAVAWGSKQQSVVALSTFEAEYIAACTCGQEVVWIRGLLGDLGIKLEQPTTIFCDNQAAIASTQNPGSKRAKHIDIRYHWVRLQVMEEKTIEFVYCNTHENFADLLTKSLDEKKTIKFRSSILGDVQCSVAFLSCKQISKGDAEWFAFQHGTSNVDGLRN
jgi:hypothetical protein